VYHCPALRIHVYGDNTMSVVHKKRQHPELMLMKKSISACYYHTVHKAITMCKCLTGLVLTHDNPTKANICKKIIPGGQKCDHLVVELILYDIAYHIQGFSLSLMLEGYFWCPFSCCLIDITAVYLDLATALKKFI
jgi:hypothetical protein